MASQFKREYKNLNANEIFNLSLENDSQKFEIAAIFKRGEKVNVNISLGAKVSELEMSFANPVHNFTWHFIKQCGVEKSGERKLLLDGKVYPVLDILVTEKLLKLSMEGSTFKREDGAIGTVFFSPNIPKSDYGHTLTLHVEYPNSPGLEAKLQALLPIQQQNVERLELLSKDSSEADIAIKKRPLRDSNFWIKSKISKARINKNQCEIERLTREIEHTMFLLNMTQDEEKRRGFGYFFYG
uniref:Uncharacterized protein n=1 Tax=Caenorhabditis japonica TaxID=281687 RepID=A0A8R1DV73_CAEJA